MICKLITLAIFGSTNVMQNNRKKFNSVEENETGNHSCDLYEVCMIAGVFFLIWPYVSQYDAVSVELF